MGSRFWISGVELGILLVMTKAKNFKEVLELLRKIEEEQYICDAEKFKEILKKCK